MKAESNYNSIATYDIKEIFKSALKQQDVLLGLSREVINASS